MNHIQVIKREAIPAITSIEEGGTIHHLGELRDFSWSEPLKHFMHGGPGFSASWVQLADGEVLKPHTHPVLSMMVFYAGAGKMLGDLARPLTGDEVVVVPPGCLHGFVGGPPGLYALSIQFAGGLYSQPEQPRVVFSNEDESLERLLRFSQQRGAAFAQRPLFDLVRSALSNPPKRRALLDALSVWLDGSEALSASRYATCNDPAFQPAFREHLSSFVGRSATRALRQAGARRVRDAALEAITNWFSYQMYVLDNAEKTALVCLVVDSVNEILQSRLSTLLGDRQVGEAFGSQQRDAEARVARGTALLGHATPDMYNRLRSLVGEAWDMADAMTDRIVAITCSAGSA